MPESQLTSKPTWSTAKSVGHVGFFVFRETVLYERLVLGARKAGLVTHH
jgi:hypothetical protein